MHYTYLLHIFDYIIYYKYSIKKNFYFDNYYYIIYFTKFTSIRFLLFLYSNTHLHFDYLLMYIIIVDELFKCIYASAVNRLITINRIQNKRFCLRNISVYNYYVYINTNACCIYLRKICCLYIKYIYI